MVDIASLRWVLTVAFAVAAGFHLARSVRPGWGGDRLSEVLHLTMCLAMIVMVWPWGVRVPATVWLAVFIASTGWFAMRAVRSAGGRRAVPVFFATAAAAMVWMSASPAVAAPRHDVAMAGMGHASGGGYAAWISAGLGGYLMLAAGWWVVRGMRLGGLSSPPVSRSVPSWPALCHGVMSAGMAVALLAMA
jgi:Domain of unknown function (DUF5134)